MNFLITNQFRSLYTYWQSIEINNSQEYMASLVTKKIFIYLRSIPIL